jgi:hypothetical protein
MALGTNFNSDLVAASGVGGTGRYSLAASATNGYFFILRMDTLLHFNTSLLAVCIDGFCRRCRNYKRLYHIYFNIAIVFSHFLYYFARFFENY